jgi:hypothetical protein
MIKQNIFLAILGDAGHGKGTLRDIFAEVMDKDAEIVSVTYSSTMKTQIAEAFITPSVKSDFPEYKNNLELLDHLKNNKPDYCVFQNLTMRDMLQTIGTEFYRHIDEDIHVKFEYRKMLEKLITNKKKEYLFVSDDTRFPNEFMNGLKVNQANGRAETVDYIKWFLNQSKNLPDLDDMKLKMKEIFNIKDATKDEKRIISKFINLALVDIDKLKKKYKTSKDWSSLIIPQTKGLSVEEGYTHGIINIFRPIVDPEIHRVNNLDKSIEGYSHLDVLTINKIKNYYADSDVEWNLKNVQKFGYARSKFSHYSERALDEQKPHPIISKPLQNKRSTRSYHEQIKNLILNNKWVNTVDVEDTNNTLRISFSAGSLFDTKKAEDIFETKGIKEYKEYLQEMEDNDEVFDPGPCLGLYLAFQKLNQQIPDDILNIEFVLITKIPPEYSAIWDSYDNLIGGEKSAKNDFNILSSGVEESVAAHLGAAVELSFVTSKKTAEELFEVGIPSIFVPNISKKHNMELYSKREGEIILVSDYDGVIGDTESERVYQKAQLNGVKNPIEEFAKHEEENQYLPMSLGPMGKVIKKLNTIIKENEMQKIKSNNIESIYPFKFTIITARGGEARKRFMNTMKEHNIQLEDFHMMSGINKNFPLEAIGAYKKNANILFIDDGDVHFNRSKELNNILSGYIVNDYNYEESLKKKNLSKPRKPRMK